MYALPYSAVQVQHPSLSNETFPGKVTAKSSDGVYVVGQGTVISGLATVVVSPDPESWILVS